MSLKSYATLVALSLLLLLVTIVAGGFPTEVVNLIVVGWATGVGLSFLAFVAVRWRASQAEHRSREFEQNVRLAELGW